MTDTFLHYSDPGSGAQVGTTEISGSDAQWVNPRPLVKRMQVTPTVSTTPAYAAKDAVGGLMEFTNAARQAGGSVRIDAVQVVDKGQQMAPLDLVLFDRTVTAPTDNAAFDPTDTELGYIVAVVPIGGYADLNDNSVANVPFGQRAVLNGTSLWGVLVARSTPTYTSTSDIVVTITVVQD